MVKKPKEYKHWITLCQSIGMGIAFAVLFIASMVLIGWYTENTTLIQVDADFAPMQYNTALGFGLVALGLISLFAGKHKITLVSALLLVILGATTLSQYIFSTNLGIDEFFMKHYIDTLVSHPGRMAPNSALCFFTVWTHLLLCCC